MKDIKDQCTTLKQSKKLIELGFTKDSASLVWKDFRRIGRDKPLWAICFAKDMKPVDMCPTFPCWTIADMMEIIKSCDVMWFEESEAYHSISVVIDSNRFVYLRDDEDEENDDVAFYKKDSLRDNLFDCLVWLKENKYL